MSNTPDLKVLREKREEILKAELAAWLHDVGKFTNAHLEHSSDGGTFRWPCDHSYKIVVDNPQRFISMSPSASSVRKPAVLNEIFNPNCNSPKAADFFPDELKQWIESTNVNIDTANYNLPELLILGVPGFATSPHRTILLYGKDGWLIALLGLSHHIAHHEKPEFRRDLIPQKYPLVRLDTSFGFSIYSFDLSSSENIEDCLEMFASLLSKSDQKKAMEILRKCFNKGWGDTRYPLNEVDLESWGLIVASFFKSQIAHFVLTKHKSDIGQWKSWRDKIIDTTASWRLLSIRTNGLGYLLSANSIPDLLARKELLTDAWNRVQKLLEEEYPLGLEVYRDENGSVFVVPDMENLLGLTDSDYNNKTLREFIVEHFQSGTVKENPCLAIRGEIVPEIHIDSDSWDGQSKLPPIGEHLKKIPILKSDPVWVESQWCIYKDEICSVCGLRPIGPYKKAKERRVCYVCEERRSDRAKEWAKELNTTIWIDEVADENGRIALIIGKFDLKHWLDGTLVRTLAVRKPDGNNGHTAEDVAKNPSFARLRRIWETTKRFWEEVEGIIKRKTEKSKRYYFEVLNKPKLGYYHAYEMHIGKVKIPVLWDTDNKRLWVIDNPDYLSSEKQLDGKLEEVLKEYENKTITLYDPAGYGKKSKEAGKVQVSKLQEDNTQYSAYISILTEPQVFMAIVPANKAFEILKAIKTKYEREMGKVRSRLPLHLGVVFAPRMMPLRSILDAGRRMLRQEAKPVVWEVENVRTFGEPNNPDEMRGLRVLNICKREDLAEESPNQFRMMHVIRLKSPDDRKRFLWFVPALMGDGQTEDHWYPYVFLACSSSHLLQGRERYYWAINPLTRTGTLLVHAGELKPGDRIYFTPATFDFIFMDNNRRRFEIFYRRDGRRTGLPQRPYLLDELDTLERCWRILKSNLQSNQQMYVLIETIERKREEWFSSFEESYQDEEFREFCMATVKNVKWKASLPEQEIEFLTWAAVSGYLRDAFELHHKILKENVVDSKDKSNQENPDSDG